MVGRQELSCQRRTSTGSRGRLYFEALREFNIDRINEALPIHFPLNDDYETLAGLLLKVYDGIPEVGTVIPVGGYEIRVLKMFKTSPELVEANLIAG